jgi:hypothetical protein
MLTGGKPGENDLILFKKKIFIKMKTKIKFA